MSTIRQLSGKFGISQSIVVSYNLHNLGKNIQSRQIEPHSHTYEYNIQNGTHRV